MSPPPRVIHLGGGPEAFLSLLRDQLERRHSGAVPEVDEDPAWTLGFEGIDPELERVREILLTIADGKIGTSGVPLLPHPSATPRVLMAGLYHGEGPEEHLLPCPVWNQIPGALGPEARVERTLDLRTGLLRQRLQGPRGAVEAVAFCSRAEPGVAVLRTRGPSSPSGGELSPPSEGDLHPFRAGSARGMAVRGSKGVVLAIARDRRRRLDTGTVSADRIAVYAGGTGEGPRVEACLERLAAAEGAGFERLLAEHRRAWASRWDDADVAIDGDPELQRSIRFALFHLMGSVAPGGEAAVGARGLSGPGYRGHVFWDADVFVLPFLAATHPPSARAMLEYRVNRLPAARAAAKRLGYRGARFPWESASTGDDVTPRMGRDLSGRRRPIRTGRFEEHIVADVAWAAASYLDWTGDRGFARGCGLELLVETARYWASRIRMGRDGRAHIYGVMGPDEYHGPVDDNAFTNVMARWNLRRAARATRRSHDQALRRERETWLRLAAALVDGYDPSTGLYEQFAGFFRLEPIIVRDALKRRPVPADLVLGPERVERAQVLKQADVLMLHHLVPDEVAPGSLRPNLEFYEPRTAHGSSLSPGVHAALFARAGRLEEALDAIRIAARVDLDDLTGATASGLHLGAMGSLWQALAFGFAGLRPAGQRLRVDPRLPPAWKGFELRVRFRGARVVLTVEPEVAVVRGDPPLGIVVPGNPPARAGPEGITLNRGQAGWEVRG